MEERRKEEIHQKNVKRRKEIHQKNCKIGKQKKKNTPHLSQEKYHTNQMCSYKKRNSHNFSILINKIIMNPNFKKNPEIKSSK